MQPSLDSIGSQKGSTDSGRHQISNIGKMDELLAGLFHTSIVRSPRRNE